MVNFRKLSLLLACACVLAAHDGRAGERPHHERHDGRSVVVVPRPPQRWIETYPGLGFATSREEGCLQAENQARMVAVAACMAGGGLRVGEEVGQCACVESGFDIVSCQLTLTEVCEKRVY